MWRNPRRSGVVIGAMAVGLWGMLFSMSFGNGMMNQLLDNMIKGFLGHMQIHNRKFPARAEGMNLGARITLEYTIPDPERVQKIISSDPSVKAWAPRLKVMGLITNAEKARGVILTGVNPAQEAKVTYISKSIVAGQYLRPDHPRDILIGKWLADKLRVDVGSKVVFMTQNINKQKAVNAFNVVGVYKTSSNDFDSGLVYTNLGALQDMVGMNGEITEIVMLITNYEERLDAVQRNLQSKMSPDVEVIRWMEVIPAIYRMLGLVDVFTFITFVMVFIAMAFGIANAVLMAVFERIRELGIMKALGTKPSEVFITVVIESLSLSMVGILVGTALGCGTVLYFSRYGINFAKFSTLLDVMAVGSVVYLKMKPIYILWGALTALLTALFSSLWPAMRAARLLPVDAIRHV